MFSVSFLHHFSLAPLLGGYVLMHSSWLSEKKEKRFPAALIISI